MTSRFDNTSEIEAVAEIIKRRHDLEADLEILLLPKGLRDENTNRTGK